MENKRFFKTKSREEQEERAHLAVWKKMIEISKQDILPHSRILDFGCNRGKFLTILYGTLGFREGVGIDIAEDAIVDAREQLESFQEEYPIAYYEASEIKNDFGVFDIIFSHEVIYLLSDLEAHAKNVYVALNKNGIYYAVTGCHTGNKLWSKWKDWIQENTSLKPMDYSVDEMANKFSNAGFSVEYGPLGFPGFMPFGEEELFPDWKDEVEYYQMSKIVFRLAKLE